MTKDEALKMAIEALEWLSYSERTAKQLEAIDACKEALEQSAQEPVDGGLDWKTKVYTILGCYRDKMTPMQVKAVQDFVEGIYTHPHQWQGLTDDVVASIWMHEAVPMNGQDFKRVYHAIEQALKEKNYG